MKKDDTKNINKKPSLIRKTGCKICNDTGEQDSGGVTPWGESIFIKCWCQGD